MPKASESSIWKWKKGESGNPVGRPKVDEHIKKIRSMTRKDIEQKISYLFSLSVAEVCELADSDITANENSLLACLAAILVKAGRYGDQNRLSFLFEWCVGKVKEIEPDAQHTIIFEEIQSGEIAKEENGSQTQGN